MPPGAGKKPKSINSLSQKAREQAAETGVLPHEWLLSVMRGDPIQQKRLVIIYHKTGPKKGEEKSREWIDETVYADFPTRIQAAKDCAPYYAPKLATQVLKIGEGSAAAVLEGLKHISEHLPV